MAEHNGFKPAEVVGPEHMAIAVGRNGPHVVLRFQKAVEWVALDAETARQCAESIARCAYEVHYGAPPPTGKSVVSDAKREMLVKRLALMLGSFARQPRMPSNGAMAVQLVDTILAEVL
jgi:hypothetical protein